MEIVPEAAETIHLIFASYLSGMGLKAIARMLNEEKRKTPAQMQMALLGKRMPERLETEIKKKYLWDGTMVGRLLKDEAYTGTLICHKSERNKINKTFRFTDAAEQFRHENYLPPIITREMWEQVQELMNMRKKSYTGLLVNHRTETHGRTVSPVPEDEQYRHENFFPVIIDREEWEQVQALLKANAKPYRGNTASHRYAGLLTCGDCGSTFVPRIRCWNGNRRVEYLCKSYMHHGKVFCPSHRIRETELNARAQQYAEELRSQWIAEQADLRKLHRLWEIKRPAINAHIAELYDEIQRLEQEVDDLLLEKIQSGG